VKNIVAALGGLRILAPHVLDKRHEEAYWLAVLTDPKQIEWFRKSAR
jgi:hypothetical protein